MREKQRGATTVLGGPIQARIDRRTELAAIREAMPTLRATVVVPRLGLDLEAGAADQAAQVVSWATAVATDAPLEILAVPFGHPLWVMFSSGTTGKPKGIVHGHGGALMEHLKYLSLQLDLHRGDRYLWYSSTSWMMWNLLVSGLLVDTTIVLYDGSPTYRTTASRHYARRSRRRRRTRSSSPRPQR